MRPPASNLARPFPALLFAPASAALGIALALVPSPLPLRAADPPRLPAKLAALTPHVDGEKLSERTAALASRDYEGRLAGTAGYDKAAEEAAVLFKAEKLLPGNGGYYLQPFDVEVAEIRRCELAVASDEGSPLALGHGEEYTCRGLTAPGVFGAPVVFAGYGISRPDLGWDDYAGLDVKGKVVLAFKDAPSWAAERKLGPESTLPRPRVRAAAAHGAVALLLVPVPRGERVPKPIGSMLEGPGPQPQAVPSFEVSPGVADRILSGTGATVAALWKEVEEKRKPAGREGGRVVSGVVETRYSAARRTANVVGVLRGAEPETRDEWIVVGAHLDHVGTQAGLLFPGANDNASGAAALMEVAAELHRIRFAPERTVVFVLFSAEEPGLLGSKTFVSSPPFPLSNLVAMLNVDSVGSGDGLSLGGGRSAPKLFELVRGLDRAGDRVTVAETGAGGGADAQAFFEKGVPTLYFATTKGYEHLHQPTDTPATLNGRLHASAANLLLRAVMEVSSVGRYPREKVEPSNAPVVPASPSAPPASKAPTAP